MAEFNLNKNSTRSKDCETAGPSSKKAADDSLCMAIVFKDYPDVHINEKQFTTINEALEDLLLRFSNKTNNFPSFVNTTLQSGAVHMECKDKYSRTWLEKTIPILKAVEGASLRVIEKNALTKTKKVSVFIPGPPKDKNKILKTLASRNPDMKAEQWIIQSCTEVPNKGQELVICMNEKSLEILKNHQLSAFFTLNKLTFKVLGSNKKRRHE